MTSALDQTLLAAAQLMRERGWSPLDSNLPSSIEWKVSQGQNLSDARYDVEEFILYLFEHLNARVSVQLLPNSQEWALYRVAEQSGHFPRLEREVLHRLSQQGVYVKVFEVESLMSEEHENGRGGTIYVRVQANTVEEACDVAAELVRREHAQLATRLQLNHPVDVHDCADHRILEERFDEPFNPFISNVESLG